MSSESAPVQDQIAFWNDVAGQAWAARQDSWDVTMQPISDAALARTNVKPGERVVDVGCGCGATSLELASLVGPQGRVLGVDVSKPMLDRAKARGAGNPIVTFAEADATAYAFDRGAADLLFSRHGVMFFPEPERAFANLRTALKPGGRLVFSCFRDSKLNPFFTAPMGAVADLLPPQPVTAPGEPGPFAFADEAHVRRILTAAGFRDVNLEPVDLSLDVGSGKGLDEALINMMTIGPASRAVRGQPADIVAKAEAALRKAFGAIEKNGAVPLGAALWVVTARV